MIPIYLKYKSIIKLIGQEKLLTLDIEFQLYEGFYTFIHKESKSFGTSTNKQTAYKILINSETFIRWYNLKLAKVYQYDHLQFSQWNNLTKNIVFQIMKNNEWTNVDENFFLQDYSNLI